MKNTICTDVRVWTSAARAQINFISKANYFMPVYIGSWTLLPILQQNWKWKEDIFFLGLIKIKIRKKINEPALIKNK